MRGGVSIPIGFSNELQLKEAAECLKLSELFQSLSGFPMSCNDLSRLGRDAKDTVSIPIGFSNELQLYTGTPGIVDAMFQSLSGFPMSCNGGASGAPALMISVSIPSRFSNELQPR